MSVPIPMMLIHSSPFWMTIARGTAEKPIQNRFKTEPFRLDGSLAPSDFV
jgi:hypothetical protein